MIERACVWSGQQTRDREREGAKKCSPSEMTMHFKQIYSIKVQIIYLFQCLFCAFPTKSIRLANAPKLVRRICNNIAICNTHTVFVCFVFFFLGVSIFVFFFVLLVILFTVCTHTRHDATQHECVRVVSQRCVCDKCPVFPNSVYHTHSVEQLIELVFSHLSTLNECVSFDQT